MSVYTHYNYHHSTVCCSNIRRGFDLAVDDEDLVFEMEEDELGRSSDVFCRKCSVGSPDIPTGESSRGSIVQHGFERPETLSIATANRIRRDHFYNPTFIKDVNINPHGGFKQNNSWDFDLDRAGHSSSVSSVEEATEILPATSRRLESGSSDTNTRETNAEPTTKSPRFLPKFLRSSFSRLISKDKTKPVLEPMSLPFFSSISLSTASSPTWSMEESEHQQMCDKNDKPYTTPDNKESLTCSPNTRKFVEDSLAKGLPLIPFNYSSADIVEKRRAERTSKVFFPVSSSSQPDDTMPGVSNSPARTKYRKLNPSMAKGEDKSLQSLLYRAKKEMEEESSHKRANDIRGYASNNSRALQRRRSSVTEYVGMTEEGKDKRLQETKKVESFGSFDRSLVKLRSRRQKFSKSYSHQDHLSDRHHTHKY